MKYVGATDNFIRMPFLVEGMLIGLLAAVFAFLILGFSYTYLLQWAGENFDQYISILLSSAVSFRDVALYIFAIFAVVGVFIGTVGSGVFVRKYLKV
jgi:cell division transport system permease protein